MEILHSRHYHSRILGAVNCSCLSIDRCAIRELWESANWPIGGGVNRMGNGDLAGWDDQSDLRGEMISLPG
jgi:hypothetical protein